MSTRLISLLLGAAALAHGQPVSVGFPSTYLRYDDNTSGNFLFGDTWHCGSYTHAGNRYCLANDSAQNATYPVAINHITVYRLSPYSVAAGANGVGINAWSHASFQSNWNANQISTTCSSHGNTHCLPYSYGIWSIAGHTYTWHHLIGNNDGIAYDAVMLRSDDIDSSPPHFCNSATLSGGNCPSNATTLGGSVPVWNSGVAGGVTFPSSTMNPIGHLMFVLPANYQDDGVNCPVIPVSAGGDGTGQYVYAFAESGDYRKINGPYRVLCSDLPLLDASKWQAWDGTMWTNTLANARAAAPAGWWVNSNGYGVRNAVGTSAYITYLPDFGVFTLMGQQCVSCSVSYQPHLLMSQTSSLTGSWTPDDVSKIQPDTFQHGTNPKTRRLSGAVATSTPGTSQSMAVTVRYDPGTDPPATPFTIQVDDEQMTVTAAGGTSWTVTRGANGVAPGHADQAPVTAPYRLIFGTGSFVQGSYSFNNGVATVDYISQGGQSDSTANDGNKTHAVYSPYIMTLRFQSAPARRGISFLGNVPLQFSMGAEGNRALPRRGLLSAFDFYDHAGRPGFGAYQSQTNVLYPKDLISGEYCSPTVNSYSGGSLSWSSAGLRFTNNDGARNQRCDTSSGWPITGGGARTTITVVNASSLSGSPLVWSVHNTNTAATWNLSLGATGTIMTCIGGSCSTTATGVVSANNWYVVGQTYSGGTMNAGYAAWLNGSAVCGPQGPVACSSNANTPNTTADFIRFGGYDTYSVWFNGTLGGFYLWNRALTAPEMSQVCQALKAAYVRRGISLTCN